MPGTFNIARMPAYKVQKYPGARDILVQRCSCGSTPGPTGECAECRRKRRLQPKLLVNQPGDRYEQEADRVADAVMRMPNPMTAHPQQTHADAERDREHFIQAKEAPGQVPEVPPETAAHINRLRGGGQPLAPAVRAYMEPRFGHDFSQVRVHTGGEAAASAQAVQARAYTLGHDVVFGAGQYAPRTTEGRRLLAHELTHVIQQQNMGAGSTAPVHRLAVQEKTARVERTTDRTAKRTPARRQAPLFSPVPAGLLQRQGIPGLSDRGQLCGDFSDFLRLLSMEDLARAGYIFPDMVTCLCLGFTGVDLLPIPGIGNNPAVEAVDCACNILTFVQELYKRGNQGGCFSTANLSSSDQAELAVLAGATAVDCLSMPVGNALGALVGSLLGVGGGTAGGPPGEAGGGIGGGVAGAIVGDFVFDVIAEVAKNMVIQGTPLPVGQAQACERFVNWLGALKMPEVPPLVGF